jgi:hypothetical protein
MQLQNNLENLTTLMPLGVATRLNRTIGIFKQDLHASQVSHFNRKTSLGQALMILKVDLKKE